VQAGGDIAGGNIFKTFIGLGENAVLKLVIAVGLLVFLTTLCSFTAGAVTAGSLLAAFSRPVPLSEEAAQSMAAKLDEISNMPAGSPFEVSLSETELNSYFHYVVAPDLGMENGEARLIAGNQIAISGDLDALGGQRVVATFDVATGVERPLELTSAAVQVVDTGSAAGWVFVPGLVLGPVESQANDALGGNFILQSTELIPDSSPAIPGPQASWVLSGNSLP
jgi:hypothetical protein